jgi:hypothetical protein
MQSLTDRRRLMRMYCDDPTAHSWFLVCRCCAGLAIIVLVTFIGLNAHDKGADSSQVASTNASGGAVAKASTKTTGIRRPNTESAPNPLVAVDMDASNPAARQPTIPVDGR